MTDMKKIFNGLILILFAALVSCADEFKVGDAFLEKAPSVDVDKDVVFNDANYARAFLWNAYTSLYYGRPLNWSAKGNRMNMGAVDALLDAKQRILPSVSGFELILKEKTID